MNKAEMVEALANKTELSKSDAKKVLEAGLEIVIKCMAQKEDLVLVGFGTFSPREQNERVARNPRTGEPVLIQPRTTVKFKPGKYLLETINSSVAE